MTEAKVSVELEISPEDILSFLRGAHGEEVLEGRTQEYLTELFENTLEKHIVQSIANGEMRAQEQSARTEILTRLGKKSFKKNKSKK